MYFVMKFEVGVEHKRKGSERLCGMGRPTLGTSCE